MEPPHDAEAPLIYYKAGLRRAFPRGGRVIEQWMATGQLATRVLPDGREIVLREELIAMLRACPRRSGASGGK